MPMQTIQLLGGGDGRLAFLRCARRHLERGGLLAIAIAETLELYEVQDGVPAPLPDICERDGVVYSSQPTAVRAIGEHFVLERRRETVTARGERFGEHNAIRPRSADAGRARARRRARPAWCPPGTQDPRDGRLRRQHGGDAACLSCASARCTRT